MSTNVTWNGTTYAIPASGETGWPALSAFLIALGNGAAVAEEMKQAIRVATTSPVTVSDTTDCVVAVNRSVAGATTVNLPAGTDGRWFVIVDQKADAATNNITVTPNGAETINGAATYVMSQNREAIVLAYSVTNTTWNVVGRYTSGAPLTNPMSAAGQMVYGAAGGTPTAVSAGTSGQILLSNGTSAPAFSSSVSAATTFANTTDTTSGSTGSIICAGGLGVAKNIWSSALGTFTSGVKVKNTGAGSTTLSWYEESTWTPVATYAGGAASATTTNDAKFTRIGRVVFLTMDITWDKSTGTGAFTVTGLPYTAAGTFHSCAIGYLDKVTIAASNAIYATVGGATISFYTKATGSASTMATATATEFASSAMRVMLTCQYYV